jgi:hypothetical protein
MALIDRENNTLQVALSTIAPFVVGLCAIRVTLLLGERYGMDTRPSS